MMVQQEKGENLLSARSLIQRAAVGGAKLVILPEMFNCPYDAGLFPSYAESYPEGETFQMLLKTAREEKVYLVGGSIPEREGSAVYNSSFVFNPQGELLGRHRKIHLFDVDLSGGVQVKESSTLSRGNEITVIHTAFGSIGLAICYDLRFPEIFRLMALEGAKIVIIPAAFNMLTGPAHWEILLRSRAVDYQVYMIAASPARDLSASYVSYGHSMMVDPWGKIVARAEEGEQVLMGNLSMDSLAAVRHDLPLLAHRRTDLYDIYKK